MNQTYEIVQILTPKERRHLLALKDTCVTYEAHQDYNLFDVSKTQVHSKHLGMYTNKFSPVAEQALHKLRDYAQANAPVGETVAQYFLDYTEESFTRFHTDDDEAVGLTMVTLLDEQDLDGGETILQHKYLVKDRPSHKYAKRSGDGKPPYGSRIVPEVISMDVGDTIVYDRHLMHGVGRVRKGVRTVLITWYSSKK